MKKTLLALSIILTVITLFGCASIVKGTKEDVSVTSNPSAHVVITAKSGEVFFDGYSPVTTSLPKKNEYTVKVTIDGYQDQIVQITKEFEMWTIGNILCGGIIGLVVDAVDGAMWKLEPNEINVSLVTVEADTEETVYLVFHALDASGQLRSHAVPFLPKAG